MIPTSQLTAPLPLNDGVIWRRRRRHFLWYEMPLPNGVLAVKWRRRPSYDTGLGLWLYLHYWRLPLTAAMQDDDWSSKNSSPMTAIQRFCLSENKQIKQRPSEPRIVTNKKYRTIRCRLTTLQLKPTLDYPQLNRLSRTHPLSHPYTSTPRAKIRVHFHHSPRAKMLFTYFMNASNRFGIRASCPVHA